MFAARVLSEFYEQVQVIDRDDLSAREGLTAVRKGVPQGGHAHALLARGHRILEGELFPGLTAQAAAAGMPVGDVGGNLRWFFNGRVLPQPDTGLTCISLFRPVFENLVRSRVKELPNVTFLDQTEILEPAFTADQTRVVGVRIRPQESGEEELLRADLVVDCTGRGARMMKWLPAHGYDTPEEERVKVGLSYTTVHYELPEDSFGHDLALIPIATPDHRRGAVFSRACGRFQLSLTGIVGDDAPTDYPGFKEFARSLPIPDIYDLIHDAEPLDSPTAVHYPRSARRHYEQLTRFPDGLLVMGDAMCSFNPVYGQGMTAASIEALALRDHLRRGSAPHFRAFFKDLSKAIDAPWEISATADLGFEGVEGKRTTKVRMINAYMGRLMTAAPKDAEVTAAFLRSAGLIDSPQALMKPGTLARVLRRGGSDNTAGGAQAAQQPVGTTAR
jgi:2-polyprenyl-6-methoxyphenol hydroxylase-like FAD-dependent oxidoreductase